MTESGLELAPFRGIRFAVADADELAGLTSPPYDVLDAAGIAELRASDPRNVVRLILPSSGDPDEAGDLFRRWRGDGTLVTDTEPALYVYEQRRADDGRVLQRGLLGGLGLRPESAGVVLPHEDVMPGPVAGRLAVMRACGGNLEPILLTYDGGGIASEVVARTATNSPASMLARTPGGLEHLLWPIREPSELSAIAADLAPRQALIADGHHRYAAYDALRAERHAAGSGAGPWDRGLALLVDQRSYPLRVDAIHRVVAEISLERFTEQIATRPGVRVEAFGADGGAARKRLAAARGTEHAFAVTDGRQWAVVGVPFGTIHVEPPLDTGVLHGLLSDTLGVTEDRIGYAHDEESAQRATAGGALAVLLEPVDVATVQDLARRGVRMPRKSTSFGPKPRTGLMMRAFDHPDEA